MKRFQIIAIAVIGLSSTAASSSVSAQVNGKINPASPCCTILSIDQVTGLVTAKTITGKIFRFKVGQAGPVDGFASKSGYIPVDGFQPVDGFVIKNRLGPVDGIGPVDAVGPVDAAKFLAGLRVGQKVWASLAGLVSINGIEPCCGIVLPSGTH
jgi:hypothetical protein